MDVFYSNLCCWKVGVNIINLLSLWGALSWTILVDIRIVIKIKKDISFYFKLKLFLHSFNKNKIIIVIAPHSLNKS